MSQQSSPSIVKIPTEIPKNLFVRISSEEYCSQLKMKRLELRKKKYGPEATLSDELLIMPSNGDIESQFAEVAAQKNYKPKFEPAAPTGAFSSPMARAGSIVALLVIGIACYSTYFGA